jgi:hypothetical protein
MVEDVVDFVSSCFQDDCWMWKTDEKVLWLKGLEVEKGERADVKTTNRSSRCCGSGHIHFKASRKSLPGVAM